MFSPAANDQLQIVEQDRFLVASVFVPPIDFSDRPSDDNSQTYVARIASDHRELVRRLTLEPGVGAVTIADAPPGGENKERRSRYADDDLSPEFDGLPTVVSYVDLNFFQTLGVRPLRGRLFEANDVPVNSGILATSVVVNSKFVERRGGEDPVGRVLRLELDPGPVKSGSPLFQIIGVVPDVEANKASHLFDGTPIAYLPAVPGAIDPMTVVVDVGADPASFAHRLRQIVAETDPTAIVRSVRVLDEPGAAARMGTWALLSLGGLAGIAIILSSTALYALMSFTVARRTREIGIRTALGGSATRIVTTVARRALIQIGVGIGLGSVFWALVLRLTTGGWGTGSAGSGDIVAATVNWPFVLILTAGAVLAVALAACLPPTLRGIRIRPMEAFRSQ